MTEETKEKPLESPQFTRSDPESGKLSRQEENWMLMTTLQIPWSHANDITDDADRVFLLEKVKEVQKFMEQQQQMQMQQQQMQGEGGRMQHEQATASNIITPQDILDGK